MKLPSLFGLAFLFLAIPSIGQSYSGQGESIYSIGKAKYEEGKYQQAADTLELAVQIFSQIHENEGLIRALNLAGECRANANQCEEATAHLQRSMDIVTKNFPLINVLTAETYYYLARATGGCARKYDEAIQLMHRSTQIKKNLFGEGKEIGLNYLSLGFFYENKALSDSAYYYLKKSLALFEKNPKVNELEISNATYHLGRNHENKGELRKALDLYLKSLTTRNRLLDPLHADISNCLNQIGSVYQKMGNSTKALEYLNKSLQIRIKSLGENHANVAATYLAIGNLHGNRNNYLQAIPYLRRGTAILESVYGNKSDIVPTYDAYIGKMYGKLGKDALATQFLQKANSNAEKNLKPDHPYLAIVYTTSGDYYIDKGDLSFADNYFKKALSILRKPNNSNPIREADVISKMGNIQARLNHPIKAEALYKNALIIYTSKFGEKNPKVATQLQLLGDVAASEKKQTMALGYYQKAFNALSKNYVDTLNYSSNPSIADVSDQSVALLIARKKADALILFSKDTNEYLLDGFKSYQFCLDLIEEIGKSYEMTAAKDALEQDMREVYEQSLELAYRLYLKTGNKNFLKEAFSISERSKSVLLLDNLQDRQAKLLGGVPDSLIDRERDLKLELAYFENQRNGFQKKGDSVKIAETDKIIFDINRQKNQLTKIFEQRYPSYFHLRYNSEKLTLDKVQESMLKKSTLLIEFFVTEKTVYKFSITKSDLFADTVALTPVLKLLISQYMTSVSDFEYIMNSKKEADSIYTFAAYALYTKLLHSSLNDSLRQPQKLIIVPDRQLAQLNFGALITSKVISKNLDYRNLEYVNKKYKISYSYSVRFLEKNMQRPHGAPEYFAGFAPEYKTEEYAKIDSASHPMIQLAMRSGNLPLPGAIKEVNLINQQMNGSVWIGSKATETNFKKISGKYQILHLAMHSLLNNENPEESELLFNIENDTENDGFLTVNEIYNLNINASLVVLSACSSGFGKIHPGEGPLSISRAFNYAGCPSVLMSLWKLPDEATSKIMTLFYQEMKKGKDKDEALQIAQHRFLQETTDPIYQHPYFWASLVPMGDTDAIPDNQEQSKVYVTTTIVILLALLTLLFIRKSFFSPASQSP